MEAIRYEGGYKDNEKRFLVICTNVLQVNELPKETLDTLK